MGNITLGNKDFDLYQDGEVVAWLNDHNDGYTLRDKTAQLWLSVLKAFNDAGPPMTVRQVFYALVSMGAIPKTEKAYNQVGYHLLQMRRRGILPYRFIADNTRWMRKPDTYTSLEAYLEDRAVAREVDAVRGMIRTLMSAMLLSIGYHTHKGQWRRRRE